MVWEGGGVRRFFCCQKKRICKFSEDFVKRYLMDRWKIAGGLILLWLAVLTTGIAQKADESGLEVATTKGTPLTEASKKGDPAGAAIVASEKKKENLGTEEAAAAAVVPAADAPVLPSPVEKPAPEPAPASETVPLKPSPAKPVNASLARTKTAAPAAVPASAIPVHYGLYRYEPIWKNSPFMLETPLNTVVTESFAKDLAVTSVSTIDGRTRVGYVNTKTRKPSSATNEKPNEDGVLVASVQPNADPSKVVVEFSQAGKTAKVSYDPSILQSKPSIPKPPPRAVLPPGANTAGRPPLRLDGGVSISRGGSRGGSQPTRRRIVLPNSVTGNQATQPAAQPPAPAVPPFLQNGKK